MDFASFKAAIKAVVFPIGEPENLVTQHDAYIVDGLNTIQQFVRCYRENNVNVVAFADTFYNCGLTTTNSPDGFIKRVYSISSDGCCKVYYVKKTRAYVQKLCDTNAIDFNSRTRPDQGTKAALPGTDLYPDVSADSSFGRAATGYWALEGCRLYLWPWLQSTEDLVIEWEGIKDTYSNADAVFDSSTHLQRAVRFYLQREIARDLDQDDAKAQRYTVDFQDALGNLFWRCRQKMEGTYAEEDELPVLLNGCNAPGSLGTFPGGSTNTPVTPPPNPWLYRFAVIGLYGMPSNLSVNADAVATLVKSWSPLFIATTGGNLLRVPGGPVSFSDFDNRIGRNYHNYISPYLGGYGPGSITGNQMWPCISDSEYQNSSRKALYLSYFPLSPPGQELRYYDRIEGPVHLFFLDSDPGAPDGRAANSVQADWLRIKLATSPCKFKIVVVAQTPYGSYSPAVVPALRWPFALWGATAVLAGGFLGYERLVTDGLPLIINGAGGEDLITSLPYPIDSRSVKLDYADHGAQLVTVNCDSVKFEFFAVNGTLRDTLIITAPTVTTA